MGVDRIVLGCGNFGGIGSDLSLVGRGESREQAFELMDAAWAGGVRRFDTASSYGGGHSEETIGAWVRERRPAGLRLTSKVFHPCTRTTTADSRRPACDASHARVASAWASTASTST